MNKTQERKDLIERAINLANELEHIEYQLPTVLISIQKLNPTKKEIEENDLDNLFNTFL